MYESEEIKKIEYDQTYKGEPLRFYVKDHNDTILVLKEGIINKECYYKVVQIIENGSILENINYIFENSNRNIIILERDYI